MCAWVPTVVDGHRAFAPEIADENAGFSSAYFENLAAKESGYFWFEARNDLICWALGKYFPQMENFLEIGCGTGFVLSGVARRFPKVRLSGSEVFRNGLSFASHRLPQAELFQMDAQRIPFAGEFDSIGAFDVLEHIEEDTVVLDQMRAAVKPGGGIVLTVPQHPALWSTADDYSFHKRRYVRRELTQKVRGAGFKPVLVTSFVTFLLPALAIERYRMNRSAGPFDPDAGFGISPALNRFLIHVLGLERRLIQLGVSLPAGGSLLMVARRLD
jgi:SAM-dependent methyltransferase